MRHTHVISTKLRNRKLESLSLLWLRSLPDSKSYYLKKGKKRKKQNYQYSRRVSSYLVFFLHILTAYTQINQLCLFLNFYKWIM